MVIDRCFGFEKNANRESQKIKYYENINKQKFSVAENRILREYILWINQNKPKLSKMGIRVYSSKCKM
jgi:hypothetical protein